jgi:uncharacterized repeat protein (TIGR01451 family)
MTLAVAARAGIAAMLLLFVPGVVAAAPDLALSMSIDVPVPGPGQPVQFTITLNNVGADLATGVVVTDKLPAELAIPPGMAACTSVGTYDPVTGAWSVGDVLPGATALLIIPAIVVAATQPPCSVNAAETDDILDTRKSNNRALAAVRGTANDTCVDLSVSGGGSVLPPCETTRHLELHVDVSNAGPDTARDVIVDLGQDPAIAPGLHFTSAGCIGLRCTIASMAPGSTVTLQAISSDFRNAVQQTLTLDFAVSSADTDYATANNHATASGPLDVFENCDINVGNVGGGGCFIATAAYGSALEPHVAALRQFRDRYLQRSAIGRAFIRFYYRHSPPMAAFIAAHPPLRFAVRAMLTPVVMTVAYPLRALAVSVLAIILLLTWRRRTRRSH